MAFIRFWKDDVSEALAKSNPNAGTCWKISNLAGAVSFLTLVGAVLLIITAIVIPAVIGTLYSSPATPSSANSGAVGMISSNLQSLDQSITSLLAVLAMLLIILSGLAFSIYGLAVAALAILHKEYLWAIGNFFIPLPVAVVYRYLKNKEILKGTSKN